MRGNGRSGTPARFAANLQGAGTLGSFVLVAILILVAGCAAPAASPSKAAVAAGQASFAALPTAGATPDAQPDTTGGASPIASASAVALPSESPAITQGGDDDEPGVVPPPEATAPPVPPGSTVAPTAGRLPGEPDPRLTPGALNPAVSQGTIGTMICVSGWTATVRPPSSYTTALKIEQIPEYGYSDTSTADYEEDHLIPLELGGAPADPANLWPEPWDAFLADGRKVGARTKDAYETSLKSMVCAGTMTLADAQARIGLSWAHSYYGIPLAAGPAPTPTPTAHPTPTRAPASRPPGTALAVAITALPASVGHGANATLAAKTSPGATCRATVTYASGTVSTAAGLKPAPTAGSGGLVSWTWKVGTATKPGRSTAVVTCTLGGASARASRTFVVT